MWSSADPKRRRSLARAACVVAVTAWSSGAFAQPAPAPAEATKTMTEDALVAAARANNPELKAGRWEKDIADAQVKAVSVLSNPVLRVEWLHTQRGLPTDAGGGWGARLSWTPPQPEEWSARREQARARTLEVQYELLERAADLEASIRTGCATADALGEQLSIAERALATRRSIVEIVEQRVQRGASTRFELNAASLAVVRAEQERDALVIQRETVLRQLAAMAGLPAGTKLALPPAANAGAAVTEGPPLPEERQLEAQALQLRPVFRADAARSEQARHLLRAEKTKRYPWLSLSSFPRVRVQEENRQNPFDMLFSVDLTLPVFDTNEGKILAVRAERHRQDDLREAHVVAVRRDIEIARNETTKRGELLARYRKTIDPILEEHATLLRDAIQGRQLDLLALLSAEDVVVRTQREYVEAELSYRKARIQLARATGVSMSGLAPRSQNR